MKEKILDYLTLQSLLDRDFQSQPNQRIKAAFLLAKKKYEKLSDDNQFDYHVILPERGRILDRKMRLLAGNMDGYSLVLNWKKNLDDAQIAKFQKELGAMGYKFQFITLAGFHALNYSMFELSKGYNAEQMTAYVKLQEAEFAAEKDGYTATKHQREVGTGYFDSVTQVITGGSSSVTALTGSTEEEQFDK